ncbi:uncharacterized protein N7511_000193 [Penicillium nucicola]|uniref:uncharacterized protein n=1 Tax=Penicillium nucicola TaxID=1850975 RepID=UPI0025456860|nr:uncharacterized protein N7511_000193 [Penicillium nucicola]KAJ5775182.1 hypothetical protein N7511_000193 [Penicillium nucicola]
MKFSTSSYARSRSRRSHTKSRIGCGNCKRRRIKCDEAAPECMNCIRHSIECNYGQAWQRDRPIVADERTMTPSTSEQPRKEYTFISSSASGFVVPKRSRRETEDSAMRQSSSTDSESTVAKSPFQFTGTDMILFHHCLSATDLKVHIPDQLIRLGLSVHYVLHLLLAISGFHMKRTSTNDPRHQYGPPDIDFYVEVERHLKSAAAEVATADPQIHQENSHSLYIASLFIFICSLARGPQPGEYLAFRDDRDIPGFCLFTGMRSILEASTQLGVSESISEVHPKQRQGVSPEREQERETEPSHGISSSEAINYKVDQSSCPFLEPLNKLKGLVLNAFSSSDPSHSTYCAIFELLLSRYNHILGGSVPIASPELWPQIFSWLYLLPDSFAKDMQQKHPVALLIFSYFAVLLNELDSVWFIRGWPLHIVEGVSRNFRAALPAVYCLAHESGQDGLILFGGPISTQDMFNLCINFFFEFKYCTSHQTRFAFHFTVSLEW